MNKQELKQFCEMCEQRHRMAREQFNEDLKKEGKRDQMVLGVMIGIEGCLHFAKQEELRKELITLRNELQREGGIK